jgi:plastocyanin
MTKLIALTIACLALGLAACGGDDDSGDSGSGGSSTGQSGGSSGGGTTVSMESIQFSPKDLTVKPGETITFKNDESVPHDVHKESGPGGGFSSGPDGGMQQGDTFDLKLDKPGTYEYVCHVHAPGMAGTITVK